ncbi:hypothetical protein PVAND_011933 [Polypedilum vanderplanki]|uniref:Secreted protein n=1 Tax=Polypedilum vanderplanki TaxID=319348 RepID=A0A9J6CKT4_POLVA|nr:hypothetical protein PVAND_011933 [Polypedilum vanderplanki]
MKIQLLLITLATFIAIFGSDAKPLDDSKLDGKIEFEEDDKTERIFIEPLPEKDKAQQSDDTKPKKSQRNYPVYYVTSKVNGRFGKSIQAFTADEFYEMYPIH